MTELLSAAIGYLIGSFPTGAIVARAFGNVDLRKVGSGRTGATNALRALGKGPAFVILLGDLAKGGLAALVGRGLSGDDSWAMAIAAFAAIVGHTFSLFLRFNGGRGVATGLGGLLAIAPWAFLVALVSGSLAIATTRYVSLGSVLGAVAGGLGLIVAASRGDVPPAAGAFGGAAAVFIALTHRDNIKRLLAGTERKLGERI